MAYESHLSSNEDWKNWKFLVPIKVTVIKEKDEESKIIKAEISVIHAALLKRDIELVKCITNRADMDDLLKLEMACNNPQGWKLTPRLI